MEVEHRPGPEAAPLAEPLAEGPVATPVATPPPTPPAPGRKPARVRIQTRPDASDEDHETLWTPASVRGWAFSLAVHVLVLVAFALIVLKPPPRPPSPIDTRLAGEPQGSDLGDDLRGGLGIDVPLAMPEAPVLAPASAPELTAPDVSAPAPSNAPRPPEPRPRSGGQDGPALTGIGQAGSGDGFGVAKFGHGGEIINNVEVKVGNPQFTLIWDSPADLDLHVLEPGGSHLYWEHRKGQQGGQLDVDDVDGFGPENVFWGGGLDRAADGPPGEYKWYVNYFGAIGGISVPTRWKMRLKHDGKVTIYEGRLAAIGQRSRTYSFTISDAEGTAPAEGTPEVATAPQPAARPAPAPGPDLAARRAELFEAPSSMKPKRDASGWVVVAPPDARFRALMPEPPTVERRLVSSPHGELELHAFFLDRGEGGYTVAYADLPPEALKSGADALLDAHASRTVSDLGGTLRDSRPLSVGDAPGRALEFDVPDRVVAGGGTAKARLFLVGDRLYAVTVVGLREFVAKPETEKFLAAFHPYGHQSKR